MQFSTTPTLEGQTIVEYCGVVTGEAILGANIFRDFFAGIRDIVGGRSGAYEKELRKAREIAFEELGSQARALGAISLAVDIAKEIKQKIREQLNLVASAGVSYNKFLAKIASDYRKPDGLCTIHPEQALDFIARLPIESFWGVGPVTAKKMHLLGIRNGLQLRKCSLEMLTAHFGKVGALYYECARGIDERPVEAVRIRKSIGCERTLERDISTRSSVIIELYHVAVELVERLNHKDFKGNTLTLKIKFHDFSQITRSLTQPQELTTLDRILPLTKELLKSVEYEQHPIRLIGLSVSNPKEEADEQHGVWEQLSFEFSDWD